jgi:hypothetical protein
MKSLPTRLRLSTKDFPPVKTVSHSCPSMIQAAYLPTRFRRTITTRLNQFNKPHATKLYGQIVEEYPDALYATQ